jgi:hypothetical protein
MGEVSGSWFIDEEDLTTRRARGHLNLDPPMEPLVEQAS